MGIDVNQLRMVALNRIANDPELQKSIANDPMRASMYQALQQGDMGRMQQLGTNFCNSAGLTPEQMGGRAMNFFQNMGRR